MSETIKTLEKYDPTVIRKYQIKRINKNVGLVEKVCLEKNVFTYKTLCLSFKTIENLLLCYYNN